MDERRRFERVTLPASARVYVEEPKGKAVGPVSVLGRGGMLVKAATRFTPATSHTLYLVDNSEGIRREIRSTALYQSDEGVAFEFDQLDPDAAVEVGVIIGKYYAAGK